MTIQRKLIVLRITRWFPVGLTMPVMVLAMLSRGFDLRHVGMVVAIQSLTVFALELPTGGLADTIGRRPLLLFSPLLDVASWTTFLFARSLPALIAAFLIQGVYRALDSGPLEAWFVDTLKRSDRSERAVSDALSRAGTATGMAVAAGAVAASALVALGSGERALFLPVVAVIVFRLIDLATIFTLVDEEPRPDRAGLGGFMATARADARRTINQTVALISGSTALAALIAVEFFWTLGMAAVGPLFPPRIEEIVGSPDTAATILGPLTAVGWMAMAFGSGRARSVANRIGPLWGVSVMQLVLAAGIAVIALVPAMVAVVPAYLVAMAGHGGANPLYQTILHRHADETNRATLLSAASMSTYPGAAVGAYGLAALAGATSLSTAMMVAVGSLVVLNLLYIPSHRELPTAEVGA